MSDDLDDEPTPPRLRVPPKQRATSSVPETVDWDSQTMRNRQPTPARLSRIEQRQDDQDKKHDALVEKVGKTREDVIEIKAETKTQSDMLRRLLDDNDHRRRTNREMWVKVIVGVATSGVFIAWIVSHL